MSAVFRLSVAALLFGWVSAATEVARATTDGAGLHALPIQDVAADRASAAEPAIGHRPLPTGGLGSVPGTEPFGLTEAAPEGLIYAAQWAAIERQLDADRAVLAACRADPVRCPKAARRLQAIVESGARREGRQRLGEINRAVNLAIAYTSDMRQYGRPNVWSAPLATFASGRGDCKDYAIAKYLALLEAGTPAEDLRLVVVRQAHPSQPLHAVLAVRLAGEWLVLDNRHFRLVATGDARDYRAVIAFGETPPRLRPTFAETDSSSDAKPS